MQYIVESGITQFLLRDGLPNTQICPLNLGSKERQLRNSDLILTYKIVGCGFGVAALIFCVEIFAQFYDRMKKKQHQLESKWTPQKNQQSHLYNQNMMMVHQLDVFGNVIKDADSTFMKPIKKFEANNWNSWNTTVVKMRKGIGAPFPYTN